MIKKYIVDYLPLLTIGTITIAFTKEYGHYQAIHINIYNYVDTSEILLGFIPFAIELSYQCAFLALGYYAFISGQTLGDKKVKPLWFFILRKYARYKKIIFSLLILLIAGFSIAISIPLWSDSPDYAKILCLLTILITLWIVALILQAIFQLRKLRIHRYGLIVCILIILWSYLSIYTKIKTRIDLDSNNYNHICFKYLNNIVFSTNEVIFFGETKDYIFLYSKKDTTAIVYHKENVDSIVIKETPFITHIRTNEKLSIRDSILITDSTKTSNRKLP